MPVRALLILLAFAGVACGPAPRATTTPAAGPAPPVAAPREEIVVLVLGDSLAAGQGLPAGQAFPALVEDGFSGEGLAVRVVNAGVSGDTTAGGLRRIDWVLKANSPDVVVVELGANDGLRGLSLADTESNLRSLIESSRSAGADVLLTGMLMPPNYGPDYADGFAAMFPRVAEETGAALLPFLLEGVAANPALNLPDGIHPNAEGHRIMAANLAEALRPLIGKRTGPR